MVIQSDFLQGHISRMQRQLAWDAEATSRGGSCPAVCGAEMASEAWKRPRITLNYVNHQSLVKLTEITPGFGA